MGIFISHRRNVITRGYVPERPENGQNIYISPILLSETKRIRFENLLHYDITIGDFTML
jgi:hypothetical protein